MTERQLVESLIGKLESLEDRSWWFHTALKFERQFPNPPFNVSIDNRRVYLTIVCPIDGERETLSVGRVVDYAGGYPFNIQSEQKAIFARALTGNSTLNIGDVFRFSMQGLLGIRRQFIANLKHWLDVFLDEKEEGEEDKSRLISSFIEQCRSLIRHIANDDNSQDRCEALNVAFKRTGGEFVFEFVDASLAWVRVYLPTGGWENVSWKYQQIKIANVLRDYVGMYESTMSEKAGESDSTKPKPTVGNQPVKSTIETETLALALLAKNPTWSKDRIARELKISPRSLQPSRAPRFSLAFNMAQPKTKDGKAGMINNGIVDGIEDSTGQPDIDQ